MPHCQTVARSADLSYASIPPAFRNQRYVTSPKVCGGTRYLMQNVLEKLVGGPHHTSYVPTQIKKQVDIGGICWVPSLLSCKTKTLFLCEGYISGWSLTDTVRHVMMFLFSCGGQVGFLVNLCVTFAVAHTICTVSYTISIKLLKDGELVCACFLIKTHTCRIQSFVLLPEHGNLLVLISLE